MNKKLSQESCLNSGEDMNSKLYDYIKIFECATISSSGEVSLLKAKLLYLGYGITDLKGPKTENCYFVINLSEDPNFYDNLFDLSKFFNQDFFLYKPKGTLSAKLIGTNQTANGKLLRGLPGYHQAIEAGLFHPAGFDDALSEMRNKIIRHHLNLNKHQSADFIGRNIS